MVIHQAYYGEKDRGHNLICTSFEQDNIARNIQLKTDLPPHAANIDWKPFFSGFPSEKYYVFLKTFPDKDAGRGSFVFTHAIFIEQEDLKELNNLNSVFQLFHDSISKENKFSPMVLDSFSKEEDSISENTGVAAILTEIIEGNKAIWLGEKGFTEMVKALWQYMSLEERMSFRFRITFNPKDYENSDLNLAYTPVALADKWSGYKLINYQSSYTGNSAAVDYIIDGDKQNIIANLSDKLQVQPDGLSKLKDWERFASIYFNDSRTIESTAILVREIRKLSPNPDQSRDIKSSILKELKTGLKKSGVKGLLLMRNIKTTPFEKGTFDLDSTFTKVIKEYFNSKASHDNFSKLLQSVKREGVEEWWSQQVQSSLSKVLIEISKQAAQKVWKHINENTGLCSLFDECIPKTDHAEMYMQQAVPDNLTEECLEQGLAFAKTRSWHSLYGKLLASKYGLKEGIDHLLNDNSGSEAEIQIKSFAKAKSEKEFIKYGINSTHLEVQNVVLDLLIESPELKNLLEIEKEEGFSLWEKTVEKGVEIFDGFKKPMEKRDRLLDILLQKGNLSDTFLNSLKNSDYTDFSLYSKRAELWGKIPIADKQFYLTQTAKEWVYHFLSGKIENKELEPELKMAITTQGYAKEIFKSRDYEISHVLDLIIFLDISSSYGIKNLMKYRVGEFSKDNCATLGELVKEKKWYDLYKCAKDELCVQNFNFEELVDVCSETFANHKKSFFSSFFGGTKNKKTMKKIFISYSRKDVDYKDELLIHLKSLEKYALIEPWDCSKIRAGEWDEQIQKELEEADIILFMVSANFMKSDYIIDNEVQKGIELAKEDSSKKIMCVLVKECIWNQWPILDENFRNDGSSDLSRFQFLPYHKDNGEETILALEDWGTGGNKSVNHAYKQIVEKLILELKN